MPRRDGDRLAVHEVAHTDDALAYGHVGPGARVCGQPDGPADGGSGVPSLRPEPALGVSPEVADRRVVGARRGERPRATLEVAAHEVEIGDASSPGTDGRRLRLEDLEGTLVEEPRAVRARQANDTVQRVDDRTQRHGSATAEVDELRRAGQAQPHGSADPADDH